MGYTIPRETITQEKEAQWLIKSSQDSDSDATQMEMVCQESACHERAVALDTSDIAMTKLELAVADLSQQREELEQSISRAENLKEAIAKNAAERQQLMAEVSDLTSNSYDEVDHADPDPKVVDLEEKVAILEAQLQTKEREMAEHHEKESATQQTLEFFLSNYFGNGPVPDGALDLVHAMATAKPPERFHNINRSCIFNILPPIITGVGQPHVVPQAEFEMVMKVYTLLSGEPDKDNLSTLVILLSNLALRQPTSKFYPIIASFGVLWGKMNNIPAGNHILFALLQFAMLQLTCAGDARFIRPGINRPAIPRLPNAMFSPTISKFAEAVFSLENGDVWEDLADKLAGICRKRSISGLRFGFHYETKTRGWFAEKSEDIVLIIDFELRSFLVADRGLCLLGQTGVAPNRYTFRIRGPFEGDDGKLIENIPEETRLWLRLWVNPRLYYEVA